MTDKQRSYIDHMKETGGFREAGRQGGLANVVNNGIESMRRRGRKGGYKTAERGSEFYRMIAKLPRKPRTKKGGANGQA